MTARQYLSWMTGTALLLAVLAVMLTVAVDPYRRFNTPPVAGLTMLKPRIDQQIGIAKTYQLERIRPRTVLLGNSRVEIGINPESLLWPQTMRPVFNAAEAGRDLTEALYMLRESIATGRLQTVIVSVDFQDFLLPNSRNTDQVPVSADEARLLVSRDGRPNVDRPWQMWRDTVASTLTIDAVLDSLETLADQDPVNAATMTPQGFNPLHEYRLFASRDGYFGIFQHATRATIEQIHRYGKPPDLSHPSLVENYRHLSAIIDLAEAHGVHVVIFTPPYHANYLEMLHSMGLWQHFLAWKHLVASLAVSTHRSGGLVSLFDCSDYDRFTTETVPSQEDRSSQMQWYWEPGHYKSALGDEILRSFLYADNKACQLVTSQNIDAIMANTDAHRIAYVGRTIQY